jgi:hypothetical protein
MSSLQDRLKNRNKLTTGGGTAIGGGSKLRDKFVKRDTGTLEKTYEERDKQTKAGSMGKSIWNLEMLEQYGIEEWQPHQTVGDHFFEIMPVSFIAHVPYHFETCVHFAVGFAKDAFICPQLSHRKPCFRCETQAKLYRKKDEYLNSGMSEDKFKDIAKKYYPQDRILYLIWERTQELLGEEAANHILKVWNAPKVAVHQEIQNKVRDKINRTTLDISDVHPGGEGRTIAMEVTKRKTSRGTFPGYSAFDLHKRENPIPDEILEQLDVITTDAQEQGFKNAIEMFLHYADYEEIKESMATEEMEEEDTDVEQAAANKPSSLRQRLRQKEEAENEAATGASDVGQSTVDETLAQIEAECAELKEELTSMSSIKFKAWCNKNDYKVALEFDNQIEAAEAIVEDIYEKLIEEADINI